MIATRLARRLRPFALALTLALAPSAAPAQDAAPSLPTEAHAAAAFFFLEVFLDGDSDIEDIRPLYPDDVDYYNRGIVSRDYVYRDKQSYMTRWPVRRYMPDLSTLTVVELTPGLYRMSLELDYEVRRPEATEGPKERSGRSLSVLEVERVAGAEGPRFVIRSEKGRVLRQ